MFDQVSIIGCGLIGSSILRRLKKNKSVKNLVCYDNNKSVCEIIKKESLSDHIASSPIDAVKNSDFILVATPISSFENIINSIKDNLKPGSILTDTCSVKIGVDNIVKKLNLYQVSTGDLLRSEVKNQTSIGKYIENIISKGDFATDEIVNELIKNVVSDPKKKDKLILF